MEEEKKGIKGTWHIDWGKLSLNIGILIIYIENPKEYTNNGSNKRVQQSCNIQNQCIIIKSIPIHQQPNRTHNF